MNKKGKKKRGKWCVVSSVR